MGPLDRPAAVLRKLSSLGCALTQVAIYVAGLLLVVKLAFVGLVVGLATCVPEAAFLLGWLAHAVLRFTSAGPTHAALTLIGLFTLAPAWWPLEGDAWGVSAVLLLWGLLALPRAGQTLAQGCAKLDVALDRAPLDLHAWEDARRATEDSLGLVALVLVAVLWLVGPLGVAPADLDQAPLVCIAGFLAALGTLSVAVLEERPQAALRTASVKPTTPPALPPGVILGPLRLDPHADHERAPACCPYCGDSLRQMVTRDCLGCGTPHHADCWDEAGRCTTYACRGTEARQVAPRPQPGRPARQPGSPNGGGLRRAPLGPRAVFRALG